MPVHLKAVALNAAERERCPDFQGIIILIFSESYFDLFYERHCKRQQDNQEKTVVVAGVEDIPDWAQMRSLFVKGILEVLLKPGALFIPLEPPFFARQWSGTQNQFLSDPLPGFLRVEDCSEVSYKDIEAWYQKQILERKDIETVRSIRSNAEKYKLLIKSVWFFGHIDVRFFRR